MSKICEAILSITPSAEVSIENEDLDKITWYADTPVIPKADIEAKMAELQAEYDAKEYQRKRSKEYPTIVDQLDDIYHNGIDEWKKTIKVTKDKYPKP